MYICANGVPQLVGLYELELDVQLFLGVEVAIINRVVNYVAVFLTAALDVIIRGFIIVITDAGVESDCLTAKVKSFEYIRFCFFR